MRSKKAETMVHNAVGVLTLLLLLASWLTGPFSVHSLAMFCVTGGSCVAGHVHLARNRRYRGKSFDHRLLVFQLFVCVTAVVLWVAGAYFVA